MTLRIGIDVGGTNTDAVAIDGTKVVANCKVSTTADIISGVVQVLGSIVEQTDTRSVHSVVIGTTHFVNALAETRRLSPVVAIRLATPAQPLPPFTDWPGRLTSATRAEAHVIAGGHQFTGAPLNTLDVDTLNRTVDTALAAGQRDFVICSIFSPVNVDSELEVARLISESCAEARITLSHQIGRVGLLERENAALLNGALRPLALHVIDGFTGALAEVGLDAPLYLSQNDGTVMNLDTAREFPILTVSSGPTNSMRGAVAESAENDCVVVDVGGTTTDIGLLRGGFPRESALTVHLGGVRTNFRIPDVVSVSIGGGSLIRRTSDGISVGPESAGNELTARAAVFGGNELTLTDIAVAAGHADIGDRTRVDDIDTELVEEVQRIVRETIADHVDRVKLEAGDIPVVLVGGGAGLVDRDIPGASRVVCPEHAGVANAIGAAMASVGGEVDRIFSLDGSTREDAIEAARHEAFGKAVDAGADVASVRVVDVDDVPLTHLPDGTATRIRVRVVGDMAIPGGANTNQEEATHAPA